MAFRRPIKLDGGNLRNMTDADILELQQETIRLYGNNPSVVLSWDQNNGTLTVMADLRAAAGPLATGSSPWPTAQSITQIAVNYRHVVLTPANLTAASLLRESYPSYSNFSYPCYFDNGNIKAMTLTDFMDTIITPAKDYLITNEGSFDNVYRAGTYTVHTTNSLSGATLVDVNPIYTDTQADISAFSSGGLPETQDQPVTAQNYYLHRFNPVASIDYTPPVVHKIDTNDLQALPTAGFVDMFSNAIRYSAVAGTDYNGTTTKILTYDFQVTSGTNATSLSSTSDTRGSGMVNTITTSQFERQEQPNSTTYYSQNVPSGTPSAERTHHLIIAYKDETNTLQ